MFITEYLRSKIISICSSLIINQPKVFTKFLIGCYRSFSFFGSLLDFFFISS